MKKIWIKSIKGFFIGLIISASANLITLQSLEPLNVLVGALLGVFIYHIFHFNV